MDDGFSKNAWTDHDLISFAVVRVALEMKLCRQICPLKKATLDLSLYNRQSGLILMVFFLIWDELQCQWRAWAHTTVATNADYTFSL